MAYLPSQPQDQAQGQPAWMPQTQIQQAVMPHADAPTTSAGAGVGAAPVGQAGGQAEAGSTAATSQPAYPNITDYLRANSGAGQNLANTVEGEVGKQVQGAKNEYDTAYNAWDQANQNAISQWQSTYNNTFDANQTALNSYAQALSNWNTQRPDVQYTWESTPTTPSLGAPANVAANSWQQVANPYYSANAIAPVAPTLADLPTSAPTLTDFTPSSDIAAKAQMAGDTISALGTEQGREAYLGNALASPNYTAGGRNLDSALMSGSDVQGDLASQYGSIVNALRGGSTVAAPTVTQPETQPYVIQTADGRTLTIDPNGNPLSGGTGYATDGGPGGWATGQAIAPGLTAAGKAIPGVPGLVATVLGWILSHGPTGGESGNAATAGNEQGLDPGSFGGYGGYGYGNGTNGNDGYGPGGSGNGYGGYGGGDSGGDGSGGGE